MTESTAGFRQITPSAFHATDGTQDWRVVGDGACAFFRTGSFGAAARFLEAIAGIAGIEDHQPDVDVRADGVTVRLLTKNAESYGMSSRDAELACEISAIARSQGVASDPSLVQSVLIVPGASDIAAIVPFWQAVLGYQRRADSPDEDLEDRLGRGPAFWFETMREPRADRGGGAIHVAVWVPQEVAEARVAAALAAGGRVVFDAHKPTWWTLADAAGNEADIATVAGRD